MSSRSPGENHDHAEWRESELYTLEQVSRLLSVSKRTVENLVSTGVLRSAIVPGTDRARRVSRRMLNEFLMGFEGEHTTKDKTAKRR